MFSPGKTAFVITILCCVLAGASCKKYVKHGELDGGVILTFDDNYVDDWYRYLPLLDSFGVKATFYVSHYPFLSAQQKSKLKIIRQHGHEIAFHTTHHANLVNMLRRKSLQEVMKEEVTDALDSMRKDGFHPQNFAFPYGVHNDILDAAMLRVFKSIRLLNGTTDYTKSVCSSTNKTYLRSLNIDEGGISTNVINRMLESAAEHHNSVVFLAHKINHPPGLYISPSRLIYILSKAKELGLRFYRVEDISR